MPRVVRWMGTGAAVALALAIGTAVHTAAAQPAASRDGQPSQFVGSDLYRMYCVTCHGRSGLGDGPLADMMKKRPPDLTVFARKNGGVYPADMVRRIIDGRQPVPGHGGKDMPVWGDAFKSAHGGGGEMAIRERIDALVQHIESLQVKATN